MKAENRDGQSIAIRQIEINNILKPEYVVESVWDENREWVIDFKYTHTEGINLPLSLFSGESGYISILLAECSSNDSAQSELGAGAYIILYYTHSETSITISTEAYDG